jgi:hypothetical protein
VVLTATEHAAVSPTSYAAITASFREFTRECRHPLAGFMRVEKHDAVGTATLRVQSKESDEMNLHGGKTVYTRESVRVVLLPQGSLSGYVDGV